MLFGGSSQPQSVEQPAQQPLQQQQQYSSDSSATAMCDPDQKALMRCLESNPSDASACQVISLLAPSLTLSYSFISICLTNASVRPRKMPDGRLLKMPDGRLLQQ